MKWWKSPMVRSLGVVALLVGAGVWNLQSSRGACVGGKCWMGNEAWTTHIFCCGVPKGYYVKTCACGGLSHPCVAFIGVAPGCVGASARRSLPPTYNLNWYGPCCGVKVCPCGGCATVPATCVPKSCGIPLHTTTICKGGCYHSL